MLRFNLAIIISMLVFAPAAYADRYTFDTSHTKILFFVNHLGFSQSIGEFTRYDGYFTFDQNAPEKSMVDVTLQPSGIRTSSSLLDEKLQGDEFFKSALFPDIRFVSTGIKVISANTGEVTGNVTLIGITKPVTIKVTFNKADYHPYTQNYVAGFSAEAMLKRSDFGMNAYIPNVGDEVRILIETEGVSDDRKKAEAIKKN